MKKIFSTIKPLLAAGIIVVILSILGIIFNHILQGLLKAGFNPEVMDIRESKRIGNYPWFTLFVGISLIGSYFIKQRVLKCQITYLPSKFILLGVVGGGILVSLREWCDYCYPVWDKYLTFSRCFYSIFTNPSNHTLLAMERFTDGYIHATSFLGPIFVALVSIFVRNITISYMVTMFIFTVATGFILKEIITRFYDVSKSDSWTYLILFFSHCTVMRSSFFPQMDPVAMFFSNLLIFLIYLYYSKKQNRYLYLMSLVLSLSLFSKGNAFPLLFLMATCYLWVSLPRKSFDWRRFLQIVLYTAVMPLGVFCFYIWYFDFSSNIVSEFKACQIEWHCIYDNPKRFILAFFSTFQIYLFFIFKKDNLRKPFFIPLVFIFFLITALIVSGASFYNRFFLPLIPSVIILSIPALEKIRVYRAPLFNLIVMWVILSNYLFIFLRLY